MQFTVGDQVVYKGETLAFTSMEKINEKYLVVLSNKSGKQIRKSHDRVEHLLGTGEFKCLKSDAPPHEELSKASSSTNKKKQKKSRRS